MAGDHVRDPMHPAIRLAVILLVVPVAGCVGPYAPAEDPAPKPGTTSDALPGLDAPYNVSNDATGCQLAGTVLTVPLDQVQDTLPDGFTARDAQGLLGTPAPTGEGAILVSVFSCAKTELQPGGWDGAEVNLYVEAPDVDGSRPVTDHDYYQMLAVGGPGNVSDLLDAYNWTHAQGTVSVDADRMVPTGPTEARAEATDADGLIWTAELTAQARNPFVGLNRFWMPLPTGVAYFDYEVDTEVVVGGVTCDLRPGSAPARAAGRTACEPGDIGIVAPDMGWVSSFHYVPGVGAA